MNKRPHAEPAAPRLRYRLLHERRPDQGASGEALSAILALFFCGITMRHYIPQPSQTAQGTSRMLFRTVSACATRRRRPARHLPRRLPRSPPQRDFYDSDASYAAALAAPGTSPRQINNTTDWKLVRRTGRAARGARLNIFLGDLQHVPQASAPRHIGDRRSCGSRGCRAVSALAMTLDDTRQENHAISDYQIMPKIVTTTLAVILFTNSSWRRSPVRSSARSDSRPPSASAAFRR